MATSPYLTDRCRESASLRLSLGPHSAYDYDLSRNYSYQQTSQLDSGGSSLYPVVELWTASIVVLIFPMLYEQLLLLFPI